MAIDWTVPVWNLVGFALIVFSAYLAISTRLTRIETRLDTVWDWWVKHVQTPAPGQTTTIIPLDQTPPEIRRQMKSIYAELARKDRELSGYRDS